MKSETEKPRAANTPAAGAREAPANDESRLAAWIWLWPPFVIVAAQVLTKSFHEEIYRVWLRGETGLVENLTVVFLVVAIVTALRLFRMRAKVASRLFGPFAIVMALGCVFFAGEEASWGQHWLGFEPPDAIAERNEQAEFNLHNDPFLETFLDQLPRNILTFAALIGGVVAPLTFRRGRRRDFAAASFSGWLWPTIVCLPAAAFAVIITLPKKLFDEVPAALEISPGETKEFCIGLFLMVYLLDLQRDLARRS